MGSAQEAELDFCGYDYIRFTVCDIQGRSRGKIVPARNARKVVQDGTEIGLSVMGQGPGHELPTFLKEYRSRGNVLMLARTETLHDVVWAGGEKYKVGAVMCEVMRRDGNPQACCPRYLARQQLERLHGLGYDIFSGIETEFRLYHRGTRKYVIEGRPYLDTDAQAVYEPLLFALDKSLYEAGVNMTDAHTELGEGQLELTCQPKFGIRTADETFIVREALKELSNLHGYDCSFMCSDAPIRSNASHLNVSLWDLDHERNLFHDEDKPDNLSDLCRYWIGGQIKHIGALTAVCCPGVNCYRRLHRVPAPHIANWGIDDRRTAFRVKNSSPNSTLIENRISSGIGNCYLMTALSIAAGIDGIVNKIEPVKEEDAVVLPVTLDEALVALEQDDVIGEALGQEFIDWFVQPKREFELKQLPGFDPRDFSEEQIQREWDMYAYL